jgi:hypothetical protein
MIRVALNPLTPIVSVVTDIGAGGRALRTRIMASSPSNAACDCCVGCVLPKGHPRWCEFGPREPVEPGEGVR